MRYLDRCHGSRTGIIEDFIGIKQVGKLSGAVIHAVAVQISSAATVIVGTQLTPVDVTVHVEEVAVAILVQCLKLGIVHGVFTGAIDIRTVGIEDNIAVANDGLDGGFPLIRVSSHTVSIDSAVVEWMPLPEPSKKK